MEFLVGGITSDQQNCDPRFFPVVSLGTVNSIKINATVFSLAGNQAIKFLEDLSHKRFTIWTFSQHEDHIPSGPLADNWSLFVAFFGALIVFYCFGRSQKEKSYSIWSICTLNVFRLSLGQPLRRDPKRWSMRIILITWVLFQMHAVVVYQGVLMSYETSVDRHTTKYLVIPNSCLTRFQRLFETGHFRISFKRYFTSTLRAKSQMSLLLSVACGGWLTSFWVFMIENWSFRFCQNGDQCNHIKRVDSKKTWLPFSN